MGNNSKSNISLPVNWIKTQLGEVAILINGDRGKNYPSASDRVSTGIPFINTGHIETSGRLSHERMDFIVEIKKRLNA